MGDDARGMTGDAAEPHDNDQAAAELRTFLIADVRGYTSFTQRHGDERAAKLAAKFARVTREVVESHLGSVLELRGDEALCVFVSPRQAIRCAVALQQRYVEETGWEAALPLPVGIGMDVGEAVAVEGGYRSGALNLAARLCSIARPGEILASPELTHLTRRLDGMSFVARDPVRLKGLAERVRPVRVVPDGEDPHRQLAALGALPPKPGSLVGPGWLPDRLRRQPRLLAALPLVVTLIAAGVVVVRTTAATSLPGLHENVLSAVDLASGRLVSQFPIGAGPAAVTVANGAVWTANQDGDTVSRFDLAKRRVTGTFDVGEAPAGIAAADGAIWVADSGSGNVSRIDPQTGAVTALTVGTGPSGITYGEGALWVVDPIGSTVYRIDPKTRRSSVVGRVNGAPTSIAMAAGELWVGSPLTATVEVLDPRNGSLVKTVHVGNDPRGVTAIGDSVWVANNLDGTVSRISTRTLTVASEIPVGAGAIAVAGDEHAVWVATAGNRMLVRVDPDGNRVVQKVPTGSAPEALASVGGTLWVAAASNPALHRGGTLSVAVQGTFKNLDPAHAYYPTGETILANSVDGLLAFRRVPGAVGDVVVPDLATDLPTVSPDGRTYTFRLRSGIEWSTGKPVTGEDIKRGLERTVAANVWRIYGDIVGAAACTRRQCDLSRGIHYDEATRLMTISLKQPDGDFLYKIASIGAAAVPSDTPIGPLEHDLPSTGPYVFSHHTATHVELDRNPHFVQWSAAAQPDGFPDRIVIDTHAGTGTQAQWTSRDWDVGVSTADVSGLRNTFGARVRVQPELGTGYLFFNPNKAPFNDVQARQAVAYALDRSAIAADWFAPATVTCQILPPGIPGYEPYCPFTLRAAVPGTWRAADLTKARRLVHQSRTAGDVVRLAFPAPVKAMQQVVDTLRNLHYKVVPVRQPSIGRYFGYLYANLGRVNAGFEGWGADYPGPANFLETQLSCAQDAANGGSNYGEYCNPKFDRAMQRASQLQLTNPAAATARWTALEHRAVDSAPLIGLVNSSVIDILGDRVGHAERHPQLGPLLDQAWVR